jgi:hypothetical protein
MGGRRLLDLSVAGDLKRRAAIPDRTPASSTGGGNEEQGREEKLFNISTAPLAVMKAQREIKRNPKRAVEMIEKILEEGG